MRPSIRIHESKPRIGSTPSSAFVAYEKKGYTTVQVKNKTDCCKIL
jgi:hypothetical protein